MGPHELSQPLVLVHLVLSEERHAVGGRRVSAVQRLEGRPVSPGQPVVQLPVGAVPLAHPAVVPPRGDTITRVSARVVMYSTPRCGLCDRAREVIFAVAARTPFQFDEVNVEGDDELELRYGLRVPVVLVDGAELFDVTVDAD